MMNKSCRVWFAVLALTVSVYSEQEGTHQPVHSFRAPFADPEVKFWKPMGDAAVQTEGVRLLNAKPNKSGQLWNTEPIFSLNWEVTLKFRITGGKFLGGDGMALWVTSVPQKTGPVFGNQADFQGLGVVFDSFDNDDKRDNPMISAMVSDGTLVYDQETDGMFSRLEGAYCRNAFRNSRTQVTVRIALVNKTLSVSVDTKDIGLMVPCFNADNVVLPKGYYLGLTAKTGEVTDQYEIYSVDFVSLDPDDIHEVAAKESALPVDSARPELTRIAHSIMHWRKMTDEEKLVHKNAHLDKISQRESAAAPDPEHDHAHHDEDDHINLMDESASTAAFFQSLAEDVEHIKHIVWKPESQRNWVIELSETLESANERTDAFLNQQQMEILKITKDVHEIKVAVGSVNTNHGNQDLDNAFRAIEAMRRHSVNDLDDSKIFRRLGTVTAAVEQHSSANQMLFCVLCVEGLIAFVVVWYKFRTDTQRKSLL